MAIALAAPARAVQVVSDEHARAKVIELEGLDPSRLVALLDLTDNS